MLTKDNLYAILKRRKIPHTAVCGKGADMNITNQKGVALLVALSISIILVILATAMLMLVRGHYGTTSNQIQHAKAYYLAEAGVQYAIARCRDGNFDDFEFDEDGKTVHVDLEINNTSGGYNISSRASY